MLTNKRFTNILWKNWKPIPLAALFALLPPKKVGERGGLRPGRPKGVYQACGATQQECHGEHRQSWGHRGRGAGDSGPSSAPPTYPSTTVTHTHTHTAAFCHGLLHMTPTTRLSMVTLTQHNHTAMQNISIVKHPTSLCSAPSHTSLYSQLKNFNAHTLKITPIISTAHKTLTGSPHDRMCTLFAGWEHRLWRLANLCSSSGSTSYSFFHLGQMI